MEKVKKILKSHKLILLLAAVMIILCAMSATTYSFFVLKKTADNIFSVGIVDLTIEEESYPESEENRWLVPKSTLPKKPRLVNTGTTDIYVLIEISVPYQEVMLINDQGDQINMPSTEGKKERELFNLISESSQTLSGKETEGFTNGFTVTDTGDFIYQKNWVFVRSEEDTVHKTHTYLFGYNSMLRSGNGNNTTTTVFDKVQLRNILEGTLPDNIVESITIKAYGIQSDELKGELQIENPDHLTKTEIEKLFEYYCNQER